MNALYATVTTVLTIIGAITVTLAALALITLIWVDLTAEPLPTPDRRDQEQQ